MLKCVCVGGGGGGGGLYQDFEFWEGGTPKFGVAGVYSI